MKYQLSRLLCGLVGVLLLTTCDEPTPTKIDNSGSYPTQIELDPILYFEGSFTVKWSQSNDEDFSSYKLYESPSENMAIKNMVFETTEVSDTVYVVTGIGENEKRFYQLIVENESGLEAESSAAVGSSYPKIVFFSDRDVRNQIYIMDMDGRNQINLTSSTAGFEQYPQFSPDGSRIIFQSGRDGNGQIYIMDADGGNQMRLSNNNGWDEHPQVSQDGSRVAFESRIDGTDNQHSIYNISLVDIYEVT